ncbi:MAG: hypothetical protein ACSHWY_08575 [Octadecabacter sp.]
MQRIIITGANGSGKSHFAAQCNSARPDVLQISSDAMRAISDMPLTDAEIDEGLDLAVTGDAWILEGGPDLLARALPRADAIVWLDVPFATRAWRLFSAPWNKGGHQPDANAGNILTRYRSAWNTLRQNADLKTQIAAALADASIPVMTCFDRVETESALALWSGSSAKG